VLDLQEREYINANDSQNQIFIKR